MRLCPGHSVVQSDGFHCSEYFTEFFQSEHARMAVGRCKQLRYAGVVFPHWEAALCGLCRTYCKVGEELGSGKRRPGASPGSDVELKEPFQGCSLRFDAHRCYFPEEHRAALPHSAASLAPAAAPLHEHPQRALPRPHTASPAPFPHRTLAPRAVRETRGAPPAALSPLRWRGRAARMRGAAAGPAVAARPPWGAAEGPEPGGASPVPVPSWRSPRSRCCASPSRRLPPRRRP